MTKLGDYVRRRRLSDIPTELLIGSVVLWLVLLATYSSPLWTHYWFGDEVRYLRTQPFPVLHAVWLPLALGLMTGRPIFYFFGGIYLGLASNWNAMPLVRLIHFAISGATLSLLLALLYRRSGSIRWALFVVLFFASQPVMQIYFAASMTSSYNLANILGCVAFLYLRRHSLASGRIGAKSLAISAALLFIAWMIFQTGPFCGLALAAYYSLTARAEDWPAERRAGIGFIAVLIATMVTYVGIYWRLITVTGASTYQRVDTALATLTGATVGEPSSFLRPANYLAPFEWWNYAIPIAPLSDERFQLLTALSAFACLALTGAALAIELSNSDRRLVWQRYALACGVLALTPLPIIADVFSGRQHLYIAFVATVILIVSRSVSVVVESVRPGKAARSVMSAVAVALLSIVLVGANAGFNRALVGPNADYYSFARVQARNAAGRAFTHAVVVGACKVCATEPCRGVFGFRMRFAAESDMDDFYRVVIRNETGRTDFDLQLAPCSNVPDKDAATTLWIDLRELEGD